MRTTRHAILRTSGCTAAALLLTLGLGTLPAEAHEGHRSPRTYTLSGDAGGSKFEGIGVDRRERTFYVSETTGGEIHRGRVGRGPVQEWKPEGADGRTTARGITTDRHDRVYVAGGPNGLGTDRPDLWVYSASGRLEAALKVDRPDVFLNDVAVGPDGAAYFTNSNAPQIFRVAREHGRWQVRLWADATGTITRRTGFNLGGIVLAPDRRSLVVAQGNAGLLWRFGLADRRVSAVDTGGADLVDADGLVRRGGTLLVVRNFSRRLTTLRLRHDGRAARLVRDVATDPDRVFTTAKIARGRLLLVDSHFDETTAQPPYQVVSLRLPHV
ncbi:SMP-30/Gluconolaconase/LRE-like region-containing protein [Friedmanniella luteola]|uniref:SMP-30/Gluconolaconase/LRE-like region-containing protein n=1 Tax=Friedmanniella luteola TaxID=546871 RepID=A0A1H1QZJ5_9ACTN|nr:SMP-30/gluconolactonase/LRE family protein [Friedmanniella luteola]SDS28934.1 SMP-30/Gluconolaconase/LRE-like region-containing protein [Friedmanniella luteola]